MIQSEKLLKNEELKVMKLKKIKFLAFFFCSKSPQVLPVNLTIFFDYKNMIILNFYQIIIICQSQNFGMCNVSKL